MMVKYSKKANLVLHLVPPWPVNRSLLLALVCFWAVHSGGKVLYSRLTAIEYGER